MLLVVLLLASCRPAEERTTIRFWAMGREAEVVGSLIPEFEREHPGLHVEVQQVPWSAAHEKLLTAYAADALPDICQLGNTWVPEFAELVALEPLDRYVAASKTVDRQDYFAGIWDTNVVDDKTSGVPWYVDTRLIFYRKDLLAAAGYDAPPKTWAEWSEAMTAIKRQRGKDRYAILLPLNEFEQLLSLALQQDDPLLRENRRGNMTSPGFRRALAYYVGMFEKDLAPPMSETQISNVWDEFFNGLFVFYVSGPWNIREFRKRAPKGLEDAWGTAPLPGPDGLGAGIAGGTSLVLFRNSSRKREAWTFVEYLSRPEVQRKFHAEIGDLPPRRSTWDHPALRDDPYAAAFRDQLERVKPTPKVLEWERIVQEMRLASERVVRGGQSQDAAVRRLNAAVDDILEKRRWVLAQRAAAAEPQP
ncbi:MAG: sugar ABC transporter substrate-binding protein [Lysobacter sp.]|nr:sugar ABC transporter substrate-binding protein [Lysobacter sp.]